MQEEIDLLRPKGYIMCYTKDTILGKVRFLHGGPGFEFNVNYL